MKHYLEHFHKYCSHSVNRKKAAVLLGFDFVFAQLQAATGMLLRSSLVKTQNSSLPNGYSISSNALAILFLAGGALISSAQTNDMTNAVAGSTNITAGVIINDTTNAVISLTNAGAGTIINDVTNATETNHPAASRPQRVKMTIHSEGPYQMDLNGHWATYQDHVRVTEGQMIMTCEWLLANLPEHGEHITNIVAMTNVVGDFIDEKNQKWHVTGDKGVYAYHVQDGVTNETITLTGNPPEILEGQDSNSMTGDAIIYDLVTKKVNIPNPTSVFWHDTNAPAGTNGFAPKI